jgi:hypothetical protein
VVILWLATAWAEDPPEPPAVVGGDEPDEPYEVIVYGEMLVEQAKAAVVQQLQEMGYDAEVVDQGDRVVYRHANGWYGEVVLYDDGWMQVKRQAMRVEGHQMPWAKRNSPGAWAGCVIWPWLCLRIGGATYGERKWRSRETMTVDALQTKVQDYGDRLADLATNRRVEALPDRLTELWEQGHPLVADRPPLATPAERRRALFEYWVSRTDTPWGLEVQEAVEAFCRGVVQHSEAPFTEAELAEFRAASPQRPFLP